jgi:type II secretory pathway component PulF
MNQPPLQLQLSDRLALCEQVARLARARLPISGELARSVRSGRLRAAAAQVDDQLQSGKSLVQTLANDDSRDARILAACIEAGESSGRLDRALEAWTAMHLSNSQANQSLRASMLYPLTLIVVALCSLAFVIWTLIPEYKTTYELFDRDMPLWLTMLTRLHGYFWWLISGLAILAVMPLVIWAVRRRRFDALGQPLDRARRFQLQALAAEIASLLLAKQVPLMQVVKLSVSATGASDAYATTAFDKLQTRGNLQPLGRETTLLLAAIHTGIMDRAQVVKLLGTLATFLRQRAKDHSQQQVRWLPMLVALVVGVLTILTYVFLIYLPWLLLLKQIISPISMGH